MSSHVVYRQLNKDYAYWTEKRRIGQMKGGQVAGLLTYSEAGQVRQNILIDVGLGTLEALADFCDDSFWDEPLAIFITHGHIDHHAELMILSEIYCQRRGKDIFDIRPPLTVYCTGTTQKHLYNTHRFGYTGGNSLSYQPVNPGEPLQCGIFTILPLAVDHFEGAVIYTITFTLAQSHKILIGWDMTTLPLANGQLQNPSLALLEATTWTALSDVIGHTSVEELVTTGFLEQLQLTYQPEQAQYGAYLVHYSGMEDPWGMLTDSQLQERIDETYPSLANLLRPAGRGQQWHFH